MLEEIKKSITEKTWKTKIPNPTLESTPSVKTMQSDYGKYLPKEILRYIETHPSEKVSYRGTTPIDYNVDFYCYGNKIPIQRLQHQMKLVIWWLTTIQKYAHRSCADLIVSVYLTPLKKELPSRRKIKGREGGGRDKVLSAINCNTGLSTRCDRGNTIIVFREEEWFKVFIHESFHYFGLDFAYSQPPSVNTELRKMFCVSPDIQLYESYTEFWAEIITMIVYSNIHSDDLSIIIDTEVQHSLGQAKKVLEIQDLTYTDVLAPCTATTKSYQEDTNVFAYYVIKTILLYFHEDFIQWCVDNNPNLLQINPSEVSKLVDWIAYHYKDPEFLFAIGNAKSNGNSLRMTYFNV